MFDPEGQSIQEQLRAAEIERLVDDNIAGIEMELAGVEGMRSIEPHNPILNRTYNFNLVPESHVSSDGTVTDSDKVYDIADAAMQNIRIRLEGTDPETQVLDPELDISKTTWRFGDKDNAHEVVEIRQKNPDSGTREIVAQALPLAEKSRTRSGKVVGKALMDSIDVRGAYDSNDRI